MRRLQVSVITVIALLFAGQAFAAGRTLSLREVEAAFFKAGIPFRTDWQYAPVNPYLRPVNTNTPRVSLPPQVRSHLTGWAYGVNPATMKGGIAWVFDSSSAAASYSQWCQQVGCAAKLLVRTDNVIYAGTPSPLASKVMSQLRNG